MEWAHANGVTLRLIEPGKPNQNAYIEYFNGRFRDECLNEHWFTSLVHARSIIRAWQREYNEDRPKKTWEEKHQQTMPGICTYKHRENYYSANRRILNQNTSQTGVASYSKHVSSFPYKDYLYFLTDENG